MSVLDLSGYASVYRAARLHRTTQYLIMAAAARGAVRTIAFESRLLVNLGDVETIARQRAQERSRLTPQTAA